MSHEDAITVLWGAYTSWGPELAALWVALALHQQAGRC